MKKFLNKISHSLIPVILLGTLAVSCKEDIEDLEPMRMFTPAGAIESTTGVSEVKLTWNPSLYTTASSGVTYTVEVAADTMFQTPVIVSVQTDTAGVVLTDDQLDVRKKYFARIKANALGDRPESHWVTSNGFKIRGEQIMLPIYRPDIKANSVLLRWNETPGLTKIVLTPQAGDPIEVAVTEEDIAAGQKVVENLQPSTFYNVEIYAGKKSRGFTSFTTTKATTFTSILAPSDDLAAAMQNSANGDIIGLEPGVYSATSTVVISGKHITVASVSGNPSDTKVNFKEFEVTGEGAGLEFYGIDFNGEEAGASYFFNLTGGAAKMKNFVIKNSIVRNVNNTILRGNRGSNNDYKADTIRIDNSYIANIGAGNYSFLLLDEMEFKSLELTSSTFNNIGRQLISWATNLSGVATPRIKIDHSTFNNFGYRDYPLLDARDNLVNLSVENSIIANIPTPGSTIKEDIMRAGSSGSTVFVAYNNFSNLLNGAGAALIFPEYAQLVSNTTIDLGWGPSTTDFTLPAGSPLRTASYTGGAIGDLRWIY